MFQGWGVVSALCAPASTSLPFHIPPRCSVRSSVRCPRPGRCPSAPVVQGGQWWSVVQPRRRNGATPKPPRIASGCLCSVQANMDSICNQQKEKADYTIIPLKTLARPCCAMGRQKGGPCSVRADADVCSLLCPLAEMSFSSIKQRSPGCMRSECSIIVAFPPDERCFEDPPSHTNTNNPCVTLAFRHPGLNGEDFLPQNEHERSSRSNYSAKGTGSASVSESNLLMTAH